MASLDRAFPLEQVDGPAVVVGQDLELDVARLLDAFLEIDRVVAEGRSGLAPAGFEGRFETVVVRDDPHALAAAAGRGLDHDRDSPGPGPPPGIPPADAEQDFIPGTIGTPAFSMVWRARTLSPTSSRAADEAAR